jgi:hypothetical protein
MAEMLGGGPAAEHAAVAAWTAMVGGIVLSRLFGESRRADEILDCARQTVLDLEAQVKADAAARKTAP